MSLPEARLVKAFNTIWSEHLKASGKKDAPASERHAIPVASNDLDAKKTVIRLIEEIGFAGVDSGSLADGVRQEPNTAVYNKPMSLAEMKQLLGS